MTALLTARVDSEKKRAAEKVFSEVGLTTSGAVNLFICAVAMRGGIPFQIEVGNRGDRKRMSNGLGRFKGCISPHDADALLKFVSDADFSKVDEEDL